MKFIHLIIFIFIVLSFIRLDAKKTVSLTCINCNDSCNSKTNILIIDINSDDNYDVSFFRFCSGAYIGFNLLDKSTIILNNEMTAQLVSGSVEAKNFLFYIYIPEIDKYICRLYYNSTLSKAVLEDYTDNGSEPSSYEEADNYFYTQQMGSLLLITKKADIDVQSVYLCSLDGRIISNLQNVEGWSQFSFDMSLEPSGMYLLRFISIDRALTKRVVYMR